MALGDWIVEQLEAQKAKIARDPIAYALVFAAGLLLGALVF